MVIAKIALQGWVEYNVSMKDIPNFIGLYAATKSGQIWSYPKRGPGRAHSGKFLKPAISGKGYERVELFHSPVLGVNRRHYVHRLVATCYLENTKEKKQVNHKDGNKTNNRVTNLEWVTPSENMQHAHSVLGISSNWKNRPKLMGKNNPKSVAVTQYTVDGLIVKKWDCIRDAVRQMGFIDSCIINCCKHNNKTHKGFVWEYTK